MSPSRTVILAATPRCAARRMVRDGQHGRHFTCGTPLRWDHAHRLWRCTDPACTATVQRAQAA